MAHSPSRLSISWCGHGVSETNDKQLDNDEFDRASRHGPGDDGDMKDSSKTTMEDRKGKELVQET